VLHKTAESCSHVITRAISPAFSISAQWSALRPAVHYPGEMTSGTHWIGGWVVLRPGLDIEARGQILRLCRGLNPGRPVCSHTLHWQCNLIVRPSDRQLRQLKARERCVRLGVGDVDQCRDVPLWLKCEDNTDNSVASISLDKANCGVNSTPFIPSVNHFNKTEMRRRIHNGGILTLRTVNK
jgi:hypothetical protein